RRGVALVLPALPLRVLPNCVRLSPPRTQLHHPRPPPRSLRRRTHAALPRAPARSPPAPRSFQLGGGRTRGVTAEDADSCQAAGHASGAQEHVEQDPQAWLPSEGIARR